MVTEIVVDTGPNIADWITALSAFGALIGAGVSVFYLKREHEHREAQARQQQAARVWAIPDVGPTAVVHNDSDLPIYNVQVMLAHKHTGERLSSGPLPHNFIPPRTPWPMLFEWSKGDTPHEIAKLSVLVSFDDAAGVRWRRGFDGWLSSEPRSQGKN